MTTLRKQDQPARRAARIDRTRAADRAIRFGTSGWRGLLGEEVTFPRLRVLVRSIADWIFEEEGGAGAKVLVGFDGRFASQAMAESATRLLRDAGLLPQLSDRPMPTPAMTRALTAGAAGRPSDPAAGLMFTASHNPAADHGLKVFGPSGGAISDDHARRIEAIAAGRMQEDGAPHSPLPGERTDFVTPYANALANVLDAEALRRSKVHVLYDAMHGMGGGVLDRVLRDSGARVEGMRLDLDPGFGGTVPDPSPARLGSLMQSVSRAQGLRLALATDGDADRIAALGADGGALSETQILALLIEHLASTGRIRRGVAIGVATGSLVEKVAARHGLEVERHPIGFKFLSAALESGRVDVAGEESGGFALAGMSRDKDGLLAGCLLANLVATTGAGLEEHIARLESEHGTSACGRIAVESRPAFDRGLERLAKRPPERVGAVPVAAVDDRHGLRLALADGGFLMWRRSGTESVLRVYGEGQTPDALTERLSLGVELLERAATVD